MKTVPFLTVSVLAVALSAAGVVAQTSEPTAPPAAASPAAPAPAPDQVIYIPRLPSPAEITSAAAAQGLTIAQIAQSASQITVIYKRADGSISTVAYQLLPAAGTPATATAATTTVVTAPPTTVVYASPAPVYYYDPFYYNPWPWFGPVAVDLGFGFGFHHGGHFRGGPGFHHGGFHGGHGGGHGGGWHRR